MGSDSGEVGREEGDSVEVGREECDCVEVEMEECDCVEVGREDCERRVCFSICSFFPGLWSASFTPFSVAPSSH